MQSLKQELLKTVEMSKKTLEQPKTETVGQKCDKYFEIIKQKCFEQSEKGLTYFFSTLNSNYSFRDGNKSVLNDNGIDFKDIQKYCELFAHENELICWKITLSKPDAWLRSIPTDYVIISWTNAQPGITSEEKYISNFANEINEKIAGAFIVCGCKKLV